MMQSFSWSVLFANHRAAASAIDHSTGPRNTVSTGAETLVGAWVTAKPANSMASRTFCHTFGKSSRWSFSSTEAMPRGQLGT